ncbi:MAG: hypothetical protein QNL51_17275 [Opitutaceae bacterium]
MINLLPALRLILGALAGAGIVWAEDTSPRIKAAMIAGMPDYHGNPFPNVIDPPSQSPPPPKMDDDDGVKLATFRVDTTRPPPNRILVQPLIRNVFEKLLPGTGVTVTETNKGSKKRSVASSSSPSSGTSAGKHHLTCRTTLPG